MENINTDFITIFKSMGEHDKAHIMNACCDYQGTIDYYKLINIIFKDKYYAYYNDSSKFKLKNKEEYFKNNKIEHIHKRAKTRNEKNTYSFKFISFHSNFIIIHTNYYDNNNNEICVYVNQHADTKIIDKFIDDNFERVEPETVYKINLLVKKGNSFDLSDYVIDPKLDLNLIDNYNDDFIEVDKKLFSIITSNKKTMSILHGLPGTGKTTYLRNLATRLLLEGKEIVYLPPNIAQVLSDPEFISNLGLFKDRVIIIEDAENVLMKDGIRSQAISNILNITDGFLADIFNIHFIFTFNMDIRDLDPALLRKGRLDLKYEFKELTSDKAKLLCDKLGTSINSSKTLADIYNSEENIVSNSAARPIGFVTN